MGISDRLKNLDTHSSVSSEFRVYTLQGAVFSLITIVAIIYLVSTEFVYNFQPSLIERVHVNATSPAGIEMEFDMTLYNVPCSRLSIDANDPNGQTQSLHLDRKHHVWKHRIRVITEEEGKDENYIPPDKKMDQISSNVVMGTKKPKIVFLGDKKVLEFGSTLLEEEHLLTELEEMFPNSRRNVTNAPKTGTNDTETTLKKNYCGSCYGAGEEGECCNTCDDVKRAYKRKSWLLRDVEAIEQCKAELEMEDIEPLDDEGCNIHGIVALSSGGGNLHLAPGRGQQSGTGLGGSAGSGTSNAEDGEGPEGENQQRNLIEDVNHLSLVDLVLRTFEQWNVSHSINKLRFGQEFPGHVHQLDNQERIIEDTYGMYQYYFQVVPTLYKFLNGTTIQTNQYSVTEHLRHVNPGSGRGLPGVFFFYEVSPLHVEISESYQKGWIAFFTSVCAVVGGVVSVMGMLDQFFFNIRKQKQSASFNTPLAR